MEGGGKWGDNGGGRVALVKGVCEFSGWNPITNMVLKYINYLLKKEVKIE